jgi:hypothetical protein
MGMKGFFPRWLLYLFLFVLYVFHNDLWLWDDPTLVMGLPIGLMYHILFCVAASLLMLLLVNFAFPPPTLGEGRSLPSDAEEGEPS